MGLTTSLFAPSRKRERRRAAARSVLTPWRRWAAALGVFAMVVRVALGILAVLPSSANAAPGIVICTANGFQTLPADALDGDRSAGPTSGKTAHVHDCSLCCGHGASTVLPPFYGLALPAPPLRAQPFPRHSDFFPHRHPAAGHAAPRAPPTIV